MAQQFTNTEAVATQGTDRTHFLQQTDDWGHQQHSAKLGHHEVDHSVLVFGAENVDRDHPVVLVLNGRPFGLQEYLTTAEARLLAKALLLAADHADSGQHLKTAAERFAADEVAA
jgi:hypothetical protein